MPPWGAAHNRRSCNSVINIQERGKPEGVHDIEAESVSSISYLKNHAANMKSYCDNDYLIS